MSLIAKGPCHCIRMRRATQAITEYYDRALKPSNITINQYMLLKSLYFLKEGSVSDLAKKVRLDRSTMVRSIKPLEDEGYIEDMADRGNRKRRLRLTEKGVAKVENTAPLWDEAQGEIEKRFEAFPEFLDLLSGLMYL